MLTGSAAVLVVPWLGGRIVGGLVAATELSLGVLACGLIVLFALQAILKILRLRVLENTSETVSASLRTDLYDHLQRLPLPWFDDQRRCDLLALITREVDQLTQFATEVVLGVLPKLIVLIGAIVLMLNLDPVLTLPIVFEVPMFYGLLKLLGRNIRPLAGEIRDAYARSVSIADENLSILQAIKSYAREGFEARRFGASVRRYRDLSLRLAAHETVIGPLVQFVAAASVVLVLWMGGSSVAQGAMTPADLVAFLLYAGLMTRPVAGLAEVWGQFQHARGALQHMEEVLAIPPEPQGGHRLKAPARGAIAVENLSYLKTYRGQIALVPQSTALVDGTIADNIRFGRSGATPEEIETAAREADAWVFVRDLPGGLDTVIGERGVRLSGGQRQRVALARALLKKPAILILDEPTSMFDPDGEARFVEIARKALEGRTVILITHRPARQASCWRTGSCGSARTARATACRTAWPWGTRVSSRRRRRAGKSCRWSMPKAAA